VSSGHIRGMLMGINLGCFEVQSTEDGDYHIKFVIKNKTNVFVGLFCLYMGQHRKSTKNTSYQS
jgi:hypothetical protein